ncbi:hypothetical protein M8C21_010455, partial [Ambrosia artemisiifolia]
TPDSKHYQPPPTPQDKKRPTNHNNKQRRPNPYAETPVPIKVLTDFSQLTTHRTRISDKYILGRELGRGEFGVTYLCTDRETKQAFACKSISKKKLRTAVDVEDVRREVAIMSTVWKIWSRCVAEHPWIQNEKKASNVPLGDIVRTRLKQFSVMNRFKKKALRVIAEHLSLEEVEVIKDMFTLMDSDGDGKVTFDELKAGLKKVGSQLAEPEIRLLMDVADVDGNGVLEYGEFVAVTIHLQKMENDEHLRRAFMFFDRDGSGFIELDELEQVLYEPGQADIQVLNEIMKEVDTDKDGQISFEEFVAMMKAGTDWRKASRQYSRERFKSLSVNLMKDGSLRLEDGLTGQSVVV